MAEPLWLSRRAARAIHAAQIATHGGSPGLRNGGLRDSALGRPKNLFAYGEPDLADLAAAYAFGFAGNHPFVDGNKRCSLAVCTTFLRRNGAALMAETDEKVAT